MLRLSDSQALAWLTTAPLLFLQERAQRRRFSQHPQRTVTFVLDTNPNYTNICDIGCSFCAFRRTRGDRDAYVKSSDQVMEDIRRAARAGLTTVLLQGGIHEDITIDYLVDLVKRTRREFPSIHPHFFSAPEIHHAANVSGISVAEALQRLYDAGQRTIPGGGAEILSPSVHRRISPRKTSPAEWLDVHQAAHRIGFKTTATMMYGHVEPPEAIIEHLSSLRALQDTTHGFLSFIPWSYKRDNNPLGRHILQTASTDLYLRIIALSRLFLDNFDHITASWFGEGKSAGVQALTFGADDFGGTVCEEAVHRAAGHVNTTTAAEVRAMIMAAGFQPVERDALYISRETVPSQPFACSEIVHPTPL